MVRAAWGADGHGSVSLGTGPARVVLHRGERTVVGVATRGSVVLAAISEIAPGGALHLLTVDVSGDRPVVRREVRASFPGGGVQPSAVVATADADGFTVLWQGIEPSSFRSARTLMMRVAEDGSFRERPHVVEVPWAIADLAWNGRGYHLALYFDGQSPTDTRLCMVTLAPDGAPEQHPWWVSEPGLVDEARLVRVGDRIVAVYRAGDDGTDLRRRDVTDVGQWGGNVGRGTRIGRIARDEDLVVRVSNGAVNATGRRF